MKLGRRARNRILGEFNQYKVFSFNNSAEPICACISKHELIKSPQIRNIIVMYSKGTFDLASVQMRFLQVAKFVLSQNINIKILALSLRPSNIVGLKNSIIVLSKFATQHISQTELVILLKNNNSIFVDPVDLEIEISKFNSDCTLIASSFEQANYFRSSTSIPVELIYHSSDLRLKELRAQNDAFAIGYFGNLARIPSEFNKLDKLSIIKTPLSYESKRDLPRYSHYLKKYSAHLVAGTTPPKHIFKPFTKGIIAANVGAVSLISEFDIEGITLLGPNYPYIAKDISIKPVLEMIEHMEKSFMTDEWILAKKLSQNLEPFYCEVNLTNSWLKLLA
jgi:hypothetical protein